MGSLTASSSAVIVGDGWRLNLAERVAVTSAVAPSLRASASPS